MCQWTPINDKSAAQFRVPTPDYDREFRGDVYDMTITTKFLRTGQVQKSESRSKHGIW